LSVKDALQFYCPEIAGSLLDEVNYFVVENACNFVWRTQSEYTIFFPLCISQPALLLRYPSILQNCWHL